MYEALRKKNLWPLITISIGIGFMILMRNRMGIFILVMSVIIAAVMKLFDIGMYQEEQKKQQTDEKEKAEAVKHAYIKKMQAETDKDSDELTVNLRAILAIGKNLVDYDQAANETVAEILKAYRVYVDKYLESATTLAAKYRRVKSYLKTQDPMTLRGEVKALKNRIGDGEKGLANTLKESEATLGRLEEMQKDQPEFRQSLDEIHATIRSLESSIKRAENDPDADTEIREEIQRTIASTSEAIETTLVKAKRAI
jgi:hypothetical protein